MINTAIIKAALIGIGTLGANEETSDRDFVKDLGVGYYSLATYVKQWAESEDFADDPEALATHAFLVGVLSERFVQALSDDPDLKHTLAKASKLYDQPSEESGADFLADSVDALYALFGVEVDSGATGEEIVTMLRDKLAENPEFEEEAKLYANIIGGTE